MEKDSFSLKNIFLSCFFADSHKDTESSSLLSNDPDVNNDRSEIPLLYEKEQWLFYGSVSVFITGLFSIIYVYLFSIFTATYNISPFVSTLNSAVSMQFFVIVGVVFSYGFFPGKKRWQKDFFFTKWNSIYILEAIGLGVFFFIPLIFLTQTTLEFLEFLKKIVGPEFARYIDTAPHLQEYFMKLEWNSFAVVVFSAVIIAPTVEEIVFRRVIYGFLSSRLGLISAVIITSALFAGIHFRLVAFSTLFVLGVIWQIQFIYHKSLFPSILYHSFHNAVVMGVLFFFKLEKMPIS